MLYLSSGLGFWFTLGRSLLLELSTLSRNSTFYHFPSLWHYPSISMLHACMWMRPVSENHSIQFIQCGVSLPVQRTSFSVSLLQAEHAFTFGISCHSYPTEVTSGNERTQEFHSTCFRFSLSLSLSLSLYLYLYLSSSSAFPCLRPGDRIPREIFCERGTLTEKL